VPARLKFLSLNAKIRIDVYFLSTNSFLFPLKFQELSHQNPPFGRDSQVEGGPADLIGIL
jgi:hypothetical protein